MIRGNQAVLELIDRAVNRDRLSHAYLFYGEKGLGKKTIAACFAKAILCRGETRPCGECPSCRKMDAGAHPDFTHLSGTAKKNELTVANIRALKLDAAVYPNDGEKKVFLISDCQRMQPPAANALLKLLEEPPEHLVILLTADDRSHVLPTILSRCIPVGVFPVGEEDCVEALLAHGADEASARRAAAACGGNVGRGLELLEPAEDRISPDGFCRLLAERREYEMLKALGGVSGDRKEYRAFLEAVSVCFRDAAVRKAGRPAEGTGAAALAAGFSQRQLLEKLRVLSRAAAELDANANPALLTVWLTGSLAGETEQ